ncbi:MAG: hypothetical protein ACI8RD_008629, partial [Bacillariaceae sp.]
GFYNKRDKTLPTVPSAKSNGILYFFHFLL